MGVQLKVPVPLPLFVKVAPEGKVEVVSVGTVPSGSVAEMVKLRFTPSVVARGPMVASTGAWLPASFTVMATISVSFSTPSEARNVMLKDPACVKPGVHTNEPVPLPLSVYVAPEGNVDVVRMGVVPSGSEADVPKLSGAPSATDFAPMAASTGDWLPASITVRVTVSVSRSTPSEARNTRL